MCQMPRGAKAKRQPEHPGTENDQAVAAVAIPRLLDRLAAEAKMSRSPAPRQQRGLGSICALPLGWSIRNDSRRPAEETRAGGALERASTLKPDNMSDLATF
ncbi:hypothetical protein MTO96_013600 [Rhipicephalus appendiculatus]